MKKLKIDYSFYLFILGLYFLGFKDLILIYIASIFFHELGHLIILKILRYQINSIEFYYFAGIIKIINLKNQKLLHELLIFSFGILFNLILLLIPKFRSINITLILINLIPLKPLDGYYILEGILSYFFNFKVVLKILKIIGYLMILILIILSILFKNFTFIIFIMITSYYLIFESYKSNYQRFLLEKYLNFNPYLPKNNIKIKEIGLIHNFKKGYNNYYMSESNLYYETNILNEYFQNNLS